MRLNILHLLPLTLVLALPPPADDPILEITRHINRHTAPADLFPQIEEQLSSFVCDLLWYKVCNQPAERNELMEGKKGRCPKVIFVWAREKEGDQYMGAAIGALMADKIEHEFGSINVWVQGVGRAYIVKLKGIKSPGTRPAGIKEAVKIFKMAHEKCRDTPIVAGAYSTQGGATLIGAIPKLSSAVKDQIKGVTLFGSTRGNGEFDIKGFPRNKTRMYCHKDDQACKDMRKIPPAYFNHEDEFAEATDWFVGLIRNYEYEI